MSYRVVQWGTGNVGKHALRMIVERPDFELAGVRVYNPEKVGIDAGDILGVASTGVVATDDIDAILALDADCVCYSSLGGTLDGGDRALDDICRLLASGKNVVSSAVEAHAFVSPDVELKSGGENAYERLTNACSEGQAAFFHVGINPGYCMDMWPINLSRVCRRIDHMRVAEIVDMSGYTSMHMVRDAIGFGRAPDEFTAVDENMSNVFESPFYLSMRMLADAIGVELEDVVYSREVAVTEKPITIAAGTIEAGTVAAMKLVLDGFIHGRPAITFEWIWRVTPDAGMEWPAGDSRWILEIDGDPKVSSELDLSTTEDAGRATSLAVATLLLNSIPTVCAAAPGLLNNLALPPHGGGYFLP